MPYRPKGHVHVAGQMGDKPEQFAVDPQICLVIKKKEFGENNNNKRI
jgi:hypothetical protein